MNSSSESETNRIQGKYLYCVASSGEDVRLGKIGIERSEVHTIPFRDICAVVHTCGPQPYQSTDDEIVKEWVLTHQYVIDAAWEKWQVVLPTGFDNIILGETENHAREKVERWLESEYERLKVKLDNVKGKAEYGVQVMWDPRIVIQDMFKDNPEMRKLREDILSKPKGLAYMYGQQLENLVKKELETHASRTFKELYERIRKQVDDIRVEKIKKCDPPMQMLLNLSCLGSMTSHSQLGEELGKIDEMEGFTVRFTGPWPPYSFVSST